MFNRLALLLGALLASAAAAGPSGAYTLSSDEGRFTLEMPDQPKFKLHRIQRVRDGAIFESKEWRLDQQPMLTWMASYRDYPSNTDGALPDTIYDRVIRELPVQLDGELRSHNFIEHDGTRGLEVLIFVPRNRLLLRSRVFVVNTRQYVVSYVGPEGSGKDSNVETYLNSFHMRQQ